MWIRNNSQRQSREAMLARMSEVGIPAMAGVEGEDCILLERPCDVTKLPGFEQGDCSVQDGAAQQAAALLDPQPGEWVLDACAAPGGKTAHCWTPAGPGWRGCRRRRRQPPQAGAGEPDRSAFRPK
jgi:16S rRNA (cytosine967-C5)-methyltransferase